MRSVLQRLALTALLPLAVASAWAQEQPADNIHDTQDAHLFFSRIEGLFDFDLPRLDPPGTIKLIFHPHFGDFTRRDYVRTDVGFRWAVNRSWEFSSEVSTFITHGLRDGNEGYGIGDWRMGGKYIFTNWLRPEFEASVALNLDQPVGRPPLDLTDGLRHIVPSFDLQHLSARDPKFSTFANFALDLVAHTRVPGTLGKNEPHDNSTALTIGAIYDLGQVKWTLAGTFTTTALLSDHADYFFSVLPSLIWYVPKRFTLHSKTQWIVGLGGRATVGPDGQDFSIGSRVRAEITFRQIMEKMQHHE